MGFSYGNVRPLSSPIIIGLASPRPATSLEDGLQRMDRLLAEAAGKGARLVCFPEAYLPGLRGQDIVVHPWDHAAQDRTLEAVQALARKHRAVVIAGMEWIVPAGRQVVAIVIDADGNEIGRQAKTQLHPTEDRFYTLGYSRRMFEVDGLRFGIAICHEGWRYPETVRWAATRGAKIVFHPQHTGAEQAPTGDDAYYEKAMEMRARENAIWFASVNYALQHPDSATSVIHPSGTPFAQLPAGEGVLVVDIDPAEATGVYAERYDPARYGDETAIPPMEALVTPQRFAARTMAGIEIERANEKLAQGTISEEAWSERISRILSEAYLIDDDPRWQSGFDGDAALWREARELVIDPVTRDGSFLDVGCANGHLMECVESWAAERGIKLEAHGLELSRELAAKARERLPAHASRIYEGNVLTWTPPRRFTYVHTGLECAPEARRPYLIRKLLDDVVEPGGRLIIGPVSSDELAEQRESFRLTEVEEPRVVQRTDRNGKTRYVLWCERT